MYAVIDVGTTGIKLSVYDVDGKRAYYEKAVLGFEKLATGMVEQNSRELLRIVRGFARKAREMGANTLGISVYRASIVAWNREGEPLTNIITWIDGRGKSVVEKLPASVKLASKLSKSLSYILSPDSPAVLMRWVYDNVPSLKEKVQSGDAFLWTLDSFLLYNVSGKFLSDATNITLTGLIHPKGFKEIGIIYDILKLPRVQPEVVNNTGDLGNLEGLEVNAVIADQQAAAIGLGVVEKGKVESVHGTGSFIEVCSGEFTMPQAGLIPIVLLKDESLLIYGVEGFLRTSGSIVDWLKNIGFYKDYDEMEKLASQGNKHVLLVPSFGGLRVPKAQNVSGLITGLTLGSTRSDIVAGLAWSVALYMSYLLKLISKNIQHISEPMWTAGGFSKSNTFLQLLADATGLRVARPTDVEASSRGVLKLLMMASGSRGKDVLGENLPVQQTFDPKLPEDYRKKYMYNFRKIIEVLPKWEQNMFLRRSL